jgi:predicted ATP-grasp superfamily ATP-dependent carboligase
MIDVLVTYSWNRVAYNALRSLSRTGLRVAVADASWMGMAMASRHASKRLVYPSFYKSEEAFIDWLEKVLLEYKPKVYLPMHEETLLVARHRERLERTGVKIPISDFATLRRLHLKNELALIAASLGVRTPLTIQPSGEADLAPFAAEAGFPVVLKELNTNSSKGVFYCSSLEELSARFKKTTAGKAPSEYPILQQYIQGPGYGVSMLMNHGQTRASFTHCRLREKTYTGGTSSKRVSCSQSEMEEMARRLLEGTGFHGVAMVEFKYDDIRKQPYLIEVNPRFWGSLALPIAAGVDFPALLYKMAVDGDVAPVTEYRQGVVCRWLLGDAMAMCSEMIHTRRVIKPLKRFLTFDEHAYDDFHWNDPLPFLVQGLYYFLKFSRTGKTNPIEDAIIAIK